MTSTAELAPEVLGQLVIDHCGHVAGAAGACAACIGDALIRVLAHHHNLRMGLTPAELVQTVLDDGTPRAEAHQLADLEELLDLRGHIRATLEQREQLVDQVLQQLVGAVAHVPAHCPKCRASTPERIAGEKLEQASERYRAGMRGSITPIRSARGT